MARVTGIGGVFFKSTSDHKRLQRGMDPDGNKVELWEPMVADDSNKER